MALRKGETVSWNSHGGEAHGKVEKKLTSDTKIKGQQIRAGKDDPKYLVRSDNGGEAAHKESALRKRGK